jgi:2-oxoglutarate/2-oxoacid ferredoxin oxidoreductase subunit beta
MSFITKPKVAHPNLPRNELGLTRRDYEGGMSTLCAGCGHDSISGAHGFNSVHGRMPSIATGAQAANGQLHYIGVSGDGDTLSIGFGQFAHAMRRNINMLYMIENNGVYGLTKGQFSASADVGSKAKKGEENLQPPIDPALAALTLGCTFIARGFSGDKEQLVPLIKAGLSHQEGSTKSYGFVRDHYDEVVHADFVPPATEITTRYAAGSSVPVTLHDGSRVVLSKLDPDYDPTDRGKAFNYLRDRQSRGEYVTGLIYIDENSPDFHKINNSSATPMNQLPFSKLTPGSNGLAKIMDRYR